MKNFLTWFLLSLAGISSSVANELGLAALSEGRFTTSILAEIGRSLGNDNVVINPLNVWAILAMVFDGSEGETKNEIGNALNVDSEKSGQVDEAFQAIMKMVAGKKNGVESKIVNLVVTAPEVTLKESFQRRIKSVFNAKQFVVDSSRQKEVSQAINKWAAEATNQRITEISHPSEFKGLKLLLGSATYFKGKWMFPFNKTDTREDKFKNDEDVIISNTVQMMRIRGIFNYSFVPALESQVIDIPYNDETSMLVILPRRKVKLQAVLENMRNKSIEELIPKGSMTAEEIDLSLPKFSTSFNGYLNEPLYNMGVKILLNPDAKLPGISDKAYITKVTHKAEIETNEEGTEASAVTAAHVVYKTTPISFQANRPFIYFVNHTPSRVILFAGKYSEPQNS